MATTTLNPSLLRPRDARSAANLELLRFVTVGSVDDGKSTLIGRLLYDTGSVPEDQLAAIVRASPPGSLDLSLLTDGLVAERQQGITIDVAYRQFSTARRRYIIADTPGHEQYTRNMATGASTADAALILVDARLGVLPQTRRHACIAHLLGIRNLAVAINKMDLVGFDHARFVTLRDEVLGLLRPLGFSSARVVPVSAAGGDNVVHRSQRSPWYDGPTLLEYLESIPVSHDSATEPFRLPVQWVIRPNLDYRGFAGQVASGVVKVGEEVIALPSGKRSRVRALDRANDRVDHAEAPFPVTVLLEDELDIARGDMLAHPSRPPQVGRHIEAHVVWMNERPLDPSRSWLLKQTTRTVRAQVDRVASRLDLQTLAEVPVPESLQLNEIGRLHLTLHRPLVFDAYDDNRQTGAFILIDPVSNETVAAGMIRAALPEPSQGRGLSAPVTVEERAERWGHVGAVLRIAGEDARSLAARLERRLFDEGFITATCGSTTSAGALRDAGILALLVAETTGPLRLDLDRDDGYPETVPVREALDVDDALSALRSARILRR